jgi:hypothetical protein
MKSKKSFFIFFLVEYSLERLIDLGILELFKPPYAEHTLVY